MLILHASDEGMALLFGLVIEPLLLVLLVHDRLGEVLFGIMVSIFAIGCFTGGLFVVFLRLSGLLFQIVDLDIQLLLLFLVGSDFLKRRCHHIPHESIEILPRAEKFTDLTHLACFDFAAELLQ